MHPILCPVDLEDADPQSFIQAIKLAKLIGVELHALHVEPTADASLTSGHHERLVDQLRSYVAGFPDAPANIQMHVIPGDPSEQIVRVATELRAQIIVMGTHGRTGFKRAVIGSVAELVVRRATCPVLVVPRASASGSA
jgi:nucleotide-binding universal stress UspA family protein